MVYEIPGRTDRVAVFMAHTDTVFPDMEPMPYYEENGRICAPGRRRRYRQPGGAADAGPVCDPAGPYPECTVLFVANSCEEGLGNLKGSRQLMKDYGDRTIEVVSFDGYYNGIANDAVGSTRYQVTVRTEGGHSFGNFGNRQRHPSAGDDH